MFDFICGLCIFIFGAFVSFTCINYIIRSLFFIKPMCKKYKIMASDLSNDIRGRYPYILASFFIIFLFSMFTYAINFYLFIFLVIAYICDIYFLIEKYQMFDLLQYINEFSADLFDWEKIYDLHISKSVKKQCFQIHHIDYKEFEDNYLEKLKYKVSNIDNNKNNILYRESSQNIW